MKFLLVMFLCSSVLGSNSCKQIEVEISEFKDHYECAINGYKFAHETISEFDREFINKHRAYIQFMCKEQADHIWDIYWFY